MNRKSFFCKAENEVGEQHSNITHIDVLFRPQILLSSNCTKTANQLKCSCETVGNPTPMTHWFLNGQPVSQSSQMVTNELLDGLHLRSIITVNEPQNRDLSTLLCFSSNSLGSAIKQFFVSWLESSRESQGLIPAFVLITRVTGFVFLVFAVLYLVWFHKTHHKARGTGGDVNTDAYQMKEKNKVPNSIKYVLYANSAALTQAENHQPGTGIKCTNSTYENVEETRECSGKKTEHLVHVSVN
ncbi:PREDICTED: uncharacterized protein LOC106913133 [Poecilia mexicana]|uniref:uncharacterized protein LOC106913133 n=1 Tax=Poecilia mexicana TaxID=48701 RepID=UPI00072E76A3|nr:PREDICTED: uncharacterized protein LOC106913133 [Poecilia mexicana]